MPRRLLTDNYRGWYGREAHTNSVLRMSNNTVWDCMHKMEQEKFRHELAMERLQATQRWEQRHSRRAYRSLQDEYSRIRAEQTVLRNHAFHIYDSARLAESPAAKPGAKRSADRKRRPKTERTPVHTSGPKTQMGKRNSLPSIDQPESVSIKATASKDGFDSWNSVDVVTLVEAEEKRKAIRSRKLKGAERGALFWTESEIMTSTVLEEDEDEDEGEDDVFYEAEDHPPVPSSCNDKETSGETVLVSLHEIQPDGSLYRRGKSPDANSFQSIDYILGGRRRPSLESGALTATHFAKPSTPKATIKPSHRTASTDNGPIENLRNPAQRTMIGLAPDADGVRTVSTYSILDGPSASTDKVSHADGHDEGLTPLRTTDNVSHADGHDEGLTTLRTTDNVSHADGHDEGLTPLRTTDKVSHADGHDKGLTPLRTTYNVFQADGHDEGLTTLSTTDKASHADRHDEDLTPLSTTDKVSHADGHDEGLTPIRTTDEVSQADEVLLLVRQSEGLTSSGTEHKTTQADKVSHVVRQAEGPTPSRTGEPTQLGHIQSRANEKEATVPSCPRPQSISKSNLPEATDAASKLSISKASPLRASSFSKSTPSPPENSTSIPSTSGNQSEPTAASKPSVLSRFRQAAEVIVEEQRCERETNMSMFAALLLNKPQRQLKVRPVEKPVGVQKEERRNLWHELLLNVQSAVRWKAKVLRERQGILNTRQMRKKAQEEQRARGRSRRHVFPGQCKTTYAMKKFLSKEVDDLMESWRPENLRRSRNRKLVERITLPEFVDRVRSTTAILREFKRYQSQREDVGV